MEPTPHFDADCVLSGINSHVHAMEDRISELESELARSSARNIELTKSKTRVGEELAASRDGAMGLYDEHLQSTSAREIERLMGQTKKQSNEANGAVHLVAASQSQVADLKRDYAALQDRCDLLRTASAAGIKRPKEQINESSAHVEQSTASDATSLRSSSTEETKIERLEVEVKRKDEELGELRNKTSDLSEQMRAMEIRITEYESRLELALQESERLRSLDHHRWKDMSELAEENRSTKASYAAAKSIIRSQGNENKDLKGELKRKDKELGKLKKSILCLSKDANRKSEILRSSLMKEMIPDYAKLRKQMAELTEEKNSYKARLAKFEEDSTSAKLIILSQGNEIEELKGRLKGKDEELHMLRSNTSDLSKEVRCMKVRMTESETRSRLSLQERETLKSSSSEEETRRCTAQGNEIEELKREVKGKEIELGKLKEITSGLYDNISANVMNLRHDLGLAQRENERLRLSLLEETRRFAQLKQVMVELTEENNSKKARLATFEEDSAKTQSCNAQIIMIASRCLSQLQMASNEVGLLSRTFTSEGEAGPDTKCPRTKFGETVVAIQATLNKLEDVANAVNLTPEIHRCPVCYDSYGGKVVPALLQCCLNHVCVDCVEKDRAQKISLLVGNKKQIQCMLCNHPFHCAKDSLWSVNRPYIDAIGIRVHSNDLHQEILSQGTISAKNNSAEAQRWIGRGRYPNGRQKNIMVATLQLDDWLMFESRDDENQQFWLGKAVAKSDWDGSCKTRNESNAAVSIEGALIGPGCYAINVQWYTQRVIGLLEYVKEGQPLVQSNEDLRLTGFNRHVNHRWDDEGSCFELDSEIKDRVESLIALRHL